MSQSSSQIKDQNTPKNPSNQEGQLKLDAYQTSDAIVIKSALAGVDQRDVEINITNDILTIKGARRESDGAEPAKYYYKECYWGDFSRSIILPSDIDTSNIKATFKNGVLTIKIPQSGKTQTQQIKIQNE